MRPLRVLVAVTSVAVSFLACSGTTDGDAGEPDQPDVAAAPDGSAPLPVDDAANERDAVADATAVDDVATPKEECEQALGSAVACYTGPAGTRNIGACKDGLAFCTDAGDVACEGDVAPSAETCNDADDDCDGLEDEDFDKDISTEHCGACNHACGEAQVCRDGACYDLVEKACSGGNDEDGDGLTDCSDPDCTGYSCGPGCLCRGGAATELDCADVSDNDGDGKFNCVDPDCLNQSCGAGCVCTVPGTARETNCRDGVDNDGDGQTDCQDAADCPQNTVCLKPDNFSGRCLANRTCG